MCPAPPSTLCEARHQVLTWSPCAGRGGGVGGGWRGRVLKSNRETAYLVLCNMATLVQRRTDMFEGCAKEFFLKATDPTCCALLKLEVLSYLVNDTNAQVKPPAHIASAG